MSLLFLNRVNIYEFVLFIGEFNIHIGFRQGRRLIQFCILIYTSTPKVDFLFCSSMISVFIILKLIKTQVF